MSAVAALISALTDAGMSSAEAAAMVARAGAEMSAGTPSKGALRTRKWRAGKTSQGVTERHAVTLPSDNQQASQSVTKRHKASPGDGAHISILPSTSTEQTIKQERKIEGAQRERASRLPPDWTPSEDDRTYAIAKGLHPDRIPIVAEKFKNHWLSKSGRNVTSPNWHLRWCTWVMNELDWNGNGAKNGHDKSVVSAQDRLNAKLRAFERGDEPDLLTDVRGGPRPADVRLLPKG